MNDERIDELRQRLRALGYLDAGVDRFVLAPAQGTRGPIGLAVRASARVGVLGGLLLGPAAALGVGARLPGLVSGARDAIVLALYLAVLFMGAIAGFTFAVSLLARRAVRAIGWVTTAACLAYLTLWWRNTNAGFGWRAPIRQSTGCGRTPAIGGSLPLNPLLAHMASTSVGPAEAT